MIGRLGRLATRVGTMGKKYNRIVTAGPKGKQGVLYQHGKASAKRTGSFVSPADVRRTGYKRMSIGGGVGLGGMAMGSKPSSGRTGIPPAHSSGGMRY